MKISQEQAEYIVKELIHAGIIKESQKTEVEEGGLNIYFRSPISVHDLEKLTAYTKKNKLLYMITSDGFNSLSIIVHIWIYKY